jgi:Holliday junction resolvase
MRYHKKVNRDANHKEIADALERAGYSVIDLAMVGDSVPDILAARNAVCVLIEIKHPEGKFSLDQLSFLANWRGHSAFASSIDEALQVMRDPERFSLTEKEKRRILQIVIKREQELTLKRHNGQKADDKPRIRVSAFEKEFRGE